MMCVADDVEEAKVDPGEKSSIEDIILTAKTQAKEAGHELCWLELDEADIDDDTLRSLEISTNFPVKFESNLFIFGTILIKITFCILTAESDWS